MKRVLPVLVVLLVLAGSPTAFSAYQYNWSTGFESPVYSAGTLADLPVNTPGQQDWFLPDSASYTNEVPIDVVPGAGIGGSQGIAQREGVSAAAKDMRFLNNGFSHTKGYAKFWVYDPGYDLTQGNVDARVGVYSSAGPGQVNHLATAQIQDNAARDPNYWYAQWAFSVVKLDGIATSDGPGWTFTTGPAAPRVWQAWSYVLISWDFDYLTPTDPTSGTGTLKWYINQSGVTPNLTVNFDSTTSRWANFHDVAGLFMGSLYPNARPAVYDNFEFHTVPEPSSLLALSAGMLGLLGAMRRRR